ncbi:acylneuraminate cytidylyltransferase family protein [Salibacterium qingdaonense]|uniref:N-acylneuraminate cytidylyltransferase n=1 Tax=Salibacterium qingdaonense TaxID=266892 RepID=A0A1I4KZK2_9BACI|nr:acylneuraminate cytidylyltransferase family protein [Salibacterium qingdaonense]SFL84091.1 N-acylneuraminate cytidylyltransferase [Salibacterium qingdaonense]
MSNICTICARGGSKGVKNKNIKMLLDKPLVAHSIEQAKRAGIFTHIAVSSDSEEILKISEEWGADFLIERPIELADDKSAKLPVIQHCVQEIERNSGSKAEIIVDLDATSPLREDIDIINTVDLLKTTTASNVITGMPARRNPYFNLVERNDEGYVYLSKSLPETVTRRQDAPECFDMNASIYAWKRGSFVNENSIFQSKTLLYEMPEERSIDIDSPLDFEFVEFIANKRGFL